MFKSLGGQMKTSSIAVCSWRKRLLNLDFSIYFQIDIFVFLQSQVCKFLSGQVKTGFAVDEKGFYSCTTSPPSRPWLHFPAISYTFSTIIILIILLIIHMYIQYIYKWSIMMHVFSNFQNYFFDLRLHHQSAAPFPGN